MSLYYWSKFLFDTIYGIWDIRMGVDFLSCRCCLRNWSINFIVWLYVQFLFSKFVTAVYLFDFLFVKKSFCVARTEDASIGEIMKFVSGTSSIPPLGLPGKSKVLFKHWCTSSNWSCKCKPTLSTCALSLTLPVHYNNKQPMKEALTEAARMSQRFDK